MKTSFLCIALAIATAFAQTGVRAQTTPSGQTPPAVTPAPPNPVLTQLHELISEVQVKLKDGKKSESDYTVELKKFDDLIAAHASEKSDAVAQVLYMKAMLYLQIFDNNAKGVELIKRVKTDYPDTQLGKNVDKILDSMAKQAEAKKKHDEMIAVGKEFPDFSEKDISGQPLSVASFKGKVVMIDFWATWCGPCRAELPNVISTYKKNHGQGFEIIGVSLDSDREKLDAFLKKQDGMTWAQYFDGQGWHNKLAEKYGIESIPATVLIGKDGKIIASDLRGEKLASAVENAVAN